MKKIVEKFTSRKFIAMILGVILGISMIFEVDGQMVSDIAGAITSSLSLLVYIIMEGKVDKEALARQMEEEKTKKEQK